MLKSKCSLLLEVLKLGTANVLGMGIIPKDKA